jgi:hypothetical protein
MPGIHQRASVCVSCDVVSHEWADCGDRSASLAEFLEHPSQHRAADAFVLVVGDDLRVLQRIAVRMEVRVEHPTHDLSIAMKLEAAAVAVVAQALYCRRGVAGHPDCSFPRTYTKSVDMRTERSNAYDL